MSGRSRHERSGSPAVRALERRDSLARQAVDQANALAEALVTGPSDDPEARRERVHLVLDVLGAVERRDGAEAVVRHAVDRARDAGVPWGSLGGALGMSDEGARTRYRERLASG